jgi:2-polyprenyl-3-methyl-5-hydroxy-6-metoxy-1,4-benzoquinol methylase
MLSDVQDRVYQNSGNLPLLELLPPPVGRILDCGCGAGDNARLLSERGWKVTGITLSRGEQIVASAHCERVFIADLEYGLPADIGQGYDVILLSHVLEHLIHPKRLLDDAKRVLASNGLLAVALPNALVYSNRLRLLLGRFEYTEAGLMDKTHLRFYTFSAARALLRTNGWDVLVACADGAFPLWRIRSAIPDGWVNWLNRRACQWCPGLFGFQSLFIARPRNQQFPDEGR